MAQLGAETKPPDCWASNATSFIHSAIETVKGEVYNLRKHNWKYWK